MADIVARPSKPSRRPREDELAGLVAALGSDLTGRVHLAYRLRPDRRWWRRRYPGGRLPEWDYCSLCGRRGLVPAESWQKVDCRVCERALDHRRHRLAGHAGPDG